MSYVGRVVEVDGETFTVEIVVDDRPLHVDIDVKHLPDVEAGDIVSIGLGQVTRVDLGTWTEEDIAEIRRRGAEQYESVRHLFGPEPSFVRGNERLARLLSDPTIAAEVAKIEEEARHAESSSDDEEGSDA